METVTFKIEKSIGYSGKRSGKSYIAKITGTCKQYIFQRSFEDTECEDKDEMFAARRKRKGSWIEAAALEAGLYEISEHGEREYRIIFAKSDKMVWMKVSVERATKIALLMDDGETFDAARSATKPPAKETTAAPVDAM